MIRTIELTQEIKNKLATDFFEDKQPLITSAGFAPGSTSAGQPRQTFTLPLTRKSIEAIERQMQGLYDELIKDCWPKDEVLPFDMIRFDAFLEPGTDQVKVLELNTRNVGLHEVVEWLDKSVAAQIEAETIGSLNQHFVTNQRLLHVRHFGENEPLLYMSPKFLPRWTYYDELVKAYKKVVHITGPEQAHYSEHGIAVGGHQYKAITKKLAWAATDAMKELDLINQIRILQPRWMRPFGLKNYLQRLSSPTILRTETYTAEHAQKYIDNKDELVLKIIDGGNSKAVYLGGLFTTEQWIDKLTIASELPEKWIVQDYFQPPRTDILAHGIGPKSLPTQLGIFLLPKPDDPTKFEMDITVKSYAGQSKHFTFDPSGLNPDIWFGHVLITD